MSEHRCEESEIGEAGAPAKQEPTSFEDRFETVEGGEVDRFDMLAGLRADSVTGHVDAVLASGNETRSKRLRDR